MKFYYYLLFSSLLIFSCKNEVSPTLQPAPTEIKYGDEEGNQSSREEWFDLIHAAAPGVNWKEVEGENSVDLGNFKSAYRQNYGYRDNILIGDGFVEGEWQERGSRNQAGSVLITEYDVKTDEIYAISAGGTMWRGSLEGNDWEVVNQDYRFSNNLLEFHYTDENTRRWIASVSGAISYSDDEGLTWTTNEDGYKNFAVSTSLKHDDDILILGVNRKSKRTEVLRTADGGENLEKLLSINTEDRTITDMAIDKVSKNVYLIEQVKSNESILYQYDADSLDFRVVNDTCALAFGNSGRANIQSYMKNDTVHLFSYKQDDQIYTSIDTGRTWTSVGALQERPWSVGIFASSYDPGNFLSGAVELLRSSNEAKSWVKVNNWWEYYGDVENKLHADMMYFEEYLDTEGEPFILISNHGGISKTYDFARNNINISLKNLNIGQFYDVRTDPTDPLVIYGGTQDQGFQRGLAPRGRIVDLEQVISGDYGHIEFTGDGRHLWTVYPGGQVSYYHEAKYSTGPRWFSVDSNDESVWIPPIEPHPVSSENSVYLAGGNINGGNGSYVIKLTYDPENFVINAEQSETDFRQVSSEVSAIAFSRFEENTCYALTRNGVFFTSEDQTKTFERTNIQLPHAHYLYGNCIYTSKIDPDRIYISGSGYSNPGVYVSYDRGENFQPMADGLPSTMVYNVVGNPEETVLYAATAAGPYAYDFNTEEWHYMGGADAPNTTFWSVEYVDQQDIVRFGTYGRGIWDFEVSSEPISSVKDKHTYDVAMYPNPTTGMLNITAEEEVSSIHIYDISGREFLSLQGDKERINIQDLPKGLYFINLNLKNGDIVSKKISKI